jgi:short-subunit dehydrogenase
MQARSLFDVNVFGLIATTKAFLPLLREHGPGARIVNIGSVAGYFTLPSIGIYCASSKFVLSGGPAVAAAC